MWDITKKYKKVEGENKWNEFEIKIKLQILKLLYININWHLKKKALLIDNLKNLIGP